MSTCRFLLPLALLAPGSFWLSSGLGAELPLLLDAPLAKSDAVIVVPQVEKKGKDEEPQQALSLEVLLKPLLSVPGVSGATLRLSLPTDNLLLTWTGTSQRPVEGSQRPVKVEKMLAGDYLDHLRKEAKLVCTLGKPGGGGLVFEVATTQGGENGKDKELKDLPLRLRRDGLTQALAGIKGAMKDWKSNATWEEVPEDAEAAPGSGPFVTLNIHGTTTLVEELKRLLDPLTLSLQTPDRLPLGYPFNSASGPAITIPPGWEQQETVPLREAANLLGVPNVQVVSVPDDIAATPLPFKTLPKSWRSGTLSQGGYAGLLRWLGVAVVFEKTEAGGTVHVDLWPANPAQAKTLKNEVPDMSEAEFSHLIHLLRSRGVRGEAACLRGSALQPTKRWIIGSRWIVDFMRRKPLELVDVIAEQARVGDTLRMHKTGEKKLSEEDLEKARQRHLELERVQDFMQRKPLELVDVITARAKVADAISLHKAKKKEELSDEDLEKEERKNRELERMLDQWELRLPLSRPLEKVTGQKVTAPAALWQNGTTVAEAVLPLAKLHINQIGADKKLVMVTPSVSGRISDSAIRIPEDPPGLFRASLEPTLYLRLLQEARNLEFAARPSTAAAPLHVTGPADAASTTTVDSPDADLVNFPHVVAQLQRQNWQADVSMSMMPGEAPDGSPTVRRTYTGPPAVMEEVNALKVAGKDGIKGPSTAALKPVATADVVETWEFPLRYAQVASLSFADVESGSETQVTGVKELLLTLIGQANDAAVSNVPSIVEHPRRNAMLITDYRNRKPFYEALIAQLDRKRSLIEVAVSVIDVTSDLDESFGSELMIGSGSGGRPDVRLGSGAQPALNPVLNALNSPGGPGRPPNFNTGLVEGQGFSISGLIASSRTQVLGRLSFLLGNGKVRAEVRPTLRTLSGVEASFSDSAKIYVTVPGANIGTAFEVPVTTKIKVLPRESPGLNGAGRSVHMVVMATDSAVVATQQTNNINTPVISSGTVTAQAEVPDGGCLLLGGRYRHVEAEVESNAPFLKNIPGLKHLFQRRVLTDERTQRFFLLSPQIVPIPMANQAAVANVPGPLPPDVMAARPASAGDAEVPVNPKKPGFLKRLFTKPKK